MNDMNVNDKFSRTLLNFLHDLKSTLDVRTTFFLGRIIMENPISIGTTRCSSCSMWQDSLQNPKIVCRIRHEQHNSSTQLRFYVAHKFEYFILIGMTWIQSEPLASTPGFAVTWHDQKALLQLHRRGLPRAYLAHPSRACGNPSLRPGCAAARWHVLGASAVPIARPWTSMDQYGPVCKLRSLLYVADVADFQYWDGMGKKLLSYLSVLMLCCRIALVLEYFQLEKNAETMQKKWDWKMQLRERQKWQRQKKMQMKNASLRKAKMTIAKKMRMKNASLRKARMTIAKKKELKNASFRKAKITVAKQMHWTT